MTYKKTLAAVAITGLCSFVVARLASKDKDLPAVCSCKSKCNKYEGLTVTAHTGCMDTAMNSLESIHAGVGNGADIVEFDLRYDQNNVAVLSHDDVTANATPVTLEEAFAAVAEYDKLVINIDVKDTTYLEQIQPLAEKYGLSERIFFTGIRFSDAKAAKEKCPLIPYYLNIDIVKPINTSSAYIKSVISRIEKSGAVGLNARASRVSYKLVSAVKAAGYPVSLWTPSTSEEIRAALPLQADNLTTRNPQLLCEIIGR